MAGSRRSGDEIHPWPPNGDLRPDPAIQVSAAAMSAVETPVNVQGD